MNSVPMIRLASGVEIPQFGFGVFQIPPPDTVAAVRYALDAGYRHIDTAQMYGNEREVGQAIAESGVPREDVFVTTKLANDRHGYDEAIAALGESLRRLGTDYVDLFLIHWPRPRLGKYVRRGVRSRSWPRTGGPVRSAFRTSHRHTWTRCSRPPTAPDVNQVQLTRPSSSRNCAHTTLVEVSPGTAWTWGENFRVFPIGAFKVLQTWTILLIGRVREINQGTGGLARCDARKQSPEE